MINGVRLPSTKEVTATFKAKNGRYKYRHLDVGSFYCDLWKDAPYSIFYDYDCFFPTMHLDCGITMFPCF